MSATPSDDPSLDHRSLADISALWKVHGGRHGERDATFYIGLARRALALGEPLFACDVCRAALNHVVASSRDHHALQKLHGLALARSGVLDEALQLAEALIDGGLLDEETISLAARIHKDLWQQSIALSARAHHLQACRALYARAYEVSHGIQSGINTATLALVAGDARQAHLVAKEVEASCRAQLVQAPGDYWLRATLAECALVLGRTEEASDLYRAAIVGMEDFGSIAATRRNARLALPTYELGPLWLEQALPMPVVAVFCGHMPDRVDRPDARFPNHVTGDMEERLRRLLTEHEVRVGYGSAAAGSDILFHEALIDAGYETHVVLPVSRERFCRTSVGVGSSWEPRFHAVLERAASVIVLSDSAEGTLAFAYANRVLLGLARIKARLVDGHLKGFAVWDDLPGAAGGTGSAVREWRSAGLEILSVHPTRDELKVLAPAPSVDDLEDPEPGRRIVSLLFADTIGFSKLEETQVNAFVEYFLGGVAKLINQMPEAPLTRNTWGDALYFAFATVEQAGSFALNLADLVNLTDWPSIGLPAGLSIRISLHGGPTTVIFDPIIGQRSYSGTHVSRAARLEPVTPPGQVFASQAFAALCEFAQVKSFTCDYAGSLPLAKGYGTYPVYHLRRQSRR
jgi:class 3 adenylate cyclase/tetratricopeptide (TPR) repeat protein